MKAVAAKELTPSEPSPDAYAASPIEPVRTLDAIHLASALLLRHSIPDLAIVTTDDRLRANASQLGFEIFPPA
jgi:predicted nucleic acid-binding protein